jgi:hypothetical protein
MGNPPVAKKSVTLWPRRNPSLGKMLNPCCRAQKLLEDRMNRTLSCVVLALSLAMPLVAQQAALSSSTAPAANAKPEAAVSTQPTATPSTAPFSRVAIGGGIGLMGINLQAATILNRYTNVRLSGNVFSYTVTGISSNGFNADGTLNFASMAVSLDYFPWPRHGFRLSPGMMAYNQNAVSMNATVTPGHSFTLNHVDYYSSATNPVTAKAKLGLNATNPAFSMTTGWGNMISRRGGHLAFPFEIGAAFVGTPSLDITLAGTACNSMGQNCVNAATDPGIQSNLNAQISKYRKDLDPLKVYPILSFGVSYNFTTRSAR